MPMFNSIVVNVPVQLLKLVPIYLMSSSRASSAVEKIFVFLEAKFDVKAATTGGIRAPDWLARQGRILGRHCRA